MKKALLIAACAAVVSQASAQDIAAVTDKLGYTGTVTKYGSLADAQNQTNAVSGPHSFAQRDAALFFVNGRPDVWTDSNLLMTAWYYTTEANTNSLPKDDPAGDRYYSGWGNPNNTNTGFVQLYDDNANTITSYNGGWTSTSYDTFFLNVTGANAGSSDTARLWNAPNTGGAASHTAGVFLSYSIDLTFSGLVGMLDGSNYTAEDHADSVTGTFSGIFQNTSATSPASNGFYRFTLDFNTDSWAFNQGDEALNGNFAPSYFSAAPVPEPATMAALGIGALALLRRRKKA